MPATPEIQAPQAGVLAVADPGATGNIFVPQGVALAVYNVPAETINAAYVNTTAIHRQTSDIRATSAAVLAVVRGTIGSPRLKTWGFTLDGHDFFVLKLGTDRKTLVYDISTEQWSWFCTEGRPSWRLSIGMNWRSAGTIPSNFGSTVIAGDDSSGVLWVLDPAQGYDESTIDEDPRTFERIATAFAIARGRTPVPVYTVDLVGSYGSPALTANSVELRYSDDRGHNYVTADEPQTSEEGNYQQEFRWMSLGLVTNPGRIFQIIDNGSFARVDGIYVNQDMKDG